MMKTFGTKIENIQYYTREGAYLIAEKDQKIAVIHLLKGVFCRTAGMGCRKISFYKKINEFFDPPSSIKAGCSAG